MLAALNNEKVMEERRMKRMSKIPNYMAAMFEAQAAGVFKPGSVYSTTVLHDDWCDQLNGRGPCNCEPELKVVEVETSEVN